jgi:cysteine-rich repeat protein
VNHPAPNTPRTVSHAMRMAHALSALGALGVVLIAAACGGGTQAATTKVDRLCTPDAWVYCRCQNRDEGSKQCNEQGTKFGPCMPCETAENPVLPDPEPEPFDPFDAGTQPEPATCGDGKVQDGEVCDDGNTNDADGCDTGCKLAGANPPSSRACPGMAVHVWGPAVEYAGTTAGAPTQVSTPACGSDQGNIPTTGSASPERIFAVTVHKSGVLVVKALDTGFDPFLYALQPCKTGSATTIACANKVSTGSETLEVPVQAGQTYALVLDGAGFQGTSITGGAFKITFAMK